MGLSSASYRVLFSGVLSDRYGSDVRLRCVSRASGAAPSEPLCVLHMARLDQLRRLEPATINTGGGCDARLPPAAGAPELFAVTQLSHRLLEHLSLRGVLETLMLFLVVWGVWVYTAWFTNWFHPDRLPVRLVLVAVMLASLLMSVAIPEAFGKRGLMFALAYVAIQVGRTAFTFIALRKSLGTSHLLSRTFQRILTWFVGSGVVW